MSKWSSYNLGKSIGDVSDGNTILYDEENSNRARITLKRNKNLTLVSLNIYGWIEHTRFFNSDHDAQREYRAMRSSVMNVLQLIHDEVNDIKIWEAISDFVRRFP